MNESKNQTNVLLLLVFALLACCIVSVAEIYRLDKKYKEQRETTDYAIEALEKCSGHLKEISKEVKSILK